MNEEVGALAVAEVFGPTFQGEGPSVGRRAGFIRLGGCNLRCTWCDTPYTWDASRFDLRQEITPWTAGRVVRRALQGSPPLVVITGGEPLLQQSRQAFVDLLGALAAEGIAVEVETNGTIRPEPTTEERVSRFNVSPKLAHAGDPRERRLRHGALHRFAELARTDAACFKFVADGTADLTEIEGICDEYAIPRRAVWVMPLGTTPEAVGQRAVKLADAVIAAGWNLSNRLHVQLWGDERGR